MDDKRLITIDFSKGSVLTDVSAQCAALARTIELSSISGKAEEAESVRMLAGYINSPSDNVMKPVVARALTEGFDHIKSVCQRYLIVGRLEDDNRLENIIDGGVLTVFKGTIPAATSTSYSMGSFTPDAGVRYKITLEGMGSTEAQVVIAYGGTTYALDAATTSCQIVGIFNGGEAVATFEPNGVPTGELVLTADSTAYAEFSLQLSMPGNFNIGVTSTIKSSAHKILVDYVLSQVLRFQRPDDSAGLLKSVEWSKEQLLKALTARNTFTRSHQDWM